MNRFVALIKDLWLTKTQANITDKVNNFAEAPKLPSDWNECTVPDVGPLETEVAPI